MNQVRGDVLGPIVSQLDLPVDSVASGLKHFFSKLPQPLIPYKSHDALMRAVSSHGAINDGSSSGGSDRRAHQRLVSQLVSLPVPNYVTLRCLARHLNK